MKANATTIAAFIDIVAAPFQFQRTGTIPRTQHIGVSFILATALLLTNALFGKKTQDWARSHKVEHVSFGRGSLADLERFAVDLA